MLVLFLLSLAVPSTILLRPTSGVSAASGDGPNIVLILADDQRFDSLWAMPNVRRLLAGHGVTFDRAFVTTSLCCPSRASILTGQESRHTGVLSNWLPDGGATRFRDRSTVATWLHDHDYTTGLVGKYLNQYPSLGRSYLPPGWDEWDAYASEPEALYYGDYTLNQNGALVHYGTFPSDYSTRVLTGRAVRFIEQANRPFFLYFAPNAPHLPFIPAPRDRGALAGRIPPPRGSFGETDLTDKPWGGGYPPFTGRLSQLFSRWQQRIAESLIELDRSVARIVAAVEARGELDDTIFFYTSDNGYLLGEHRLFEKGWPYEESIRVPLVVRVPGQAAGRVDHHLVLNTDLAPTFAALAGVRPGLRVDGRSLVPLLEGTRSPASWRTAFVEEYLGQPWEGGPPRFEAIRTERYLFVEYRNGWRELYDLQTDPDELDNLAGEPDSRALEAELAHQLERLLRE